MDKNPRSGVYKWVNLSNGKVYVGSAVNINSRLRVHRSLLRRGIHKNEHLQRSWNKYGEKSFSFVIIEFCGLESLIDREQHWIDTHKAVNPDFGYNNRPDADSMLGFKFSEEARVKISIAQKRVWDSPEYREAASEAGKKRCADPIVRSRMSKAAKECSKRPEVCAKRSAAQKNRKTTEVTKEKISKKSKASWDSPEGKIRRIRLSERNRGKRSEETKRKISEAIKLVRQRKR